MAKVSTNRTTGCLLGPAVGDAVGTTFGFSSPGQLEPLTDMVGGGPFALEAGQRTDDPSMALCLADSIIQCQGFKPADQMSRYLRWMREGYLSSNGRCFDVGNTVRNALLRFEADREALAGSTAPDSAGNGSLMRLAPVPIAWQLSPSNAVELSGQSSRTTHGAREAVDACRYYGGLTCGALRGISKDDLLSPCWAPDGVDFTQEPLSAEVERVARGSIKAKSPPEIRGSGYVIESMEAALWALYKTDDFKTGCLMAANLGNDADTTAAIYGQLAGAIYGAEKIPSSWLSRLAMKDRIEQMALRLPLDEEPK